MVTQPIPPGVAGAIPYLFVDNGFAAMDWYCRHFGGTEVMRMPGPGGSGLMHGEIQVGGNTLMLSEANLDWGTRAPQPGDAQTAKLMLYVEDVDAAMVACENGGATVVKPAEDMFWGDRMGEIRDPFGHGWVLATHIEDVSPAEVERRAKEMFGE